MIYKVAGVGFCCLLLIVGLLILFRDESMDQVYFSPQKIDSMQIRDMVTERYFSIHARGKINAICTQMGHSMRFDMKDPKGGPLFIFCLFLYKRGERI
jgi:hypothetical protein